MVLPARPGAPLIAWDTLTLKQIHELRDELPLAAGAADTPGASRGGQRFQGAVDVLCEYMGLCVDWERVRLVRGTDVEGEEAGRQTSPTSNLLVNEDERKAAVRDALAMLIVAAACSKDSKEVKKEIDDDRAGIVIFRIP